MLKRLNAIWIPDSRTIWLPGKWTPSCCLMYWSGIQMVGVVHKTKHIDQPFEYRTILKFKLQKVLYSNVFGMQIPTVLRFECILLFSGEGYFWIRPEHEHWEDHVSGHPGCPLLLLFISIHLRRQERRCVPHSMRYWPGKLTFFLILPECKIIHVTDGMNAKPKFEGNRGCYVTDGMRVTLVGG